MSQKTALLIAAGLTAFVLVMIGGVVARVIAAGPSTDLTAVQSSPTADQIGPASLPAPATASPTSEAYPISSQLAATIALNLAPGAQVLKSPELVNFQGVAAYEVSLDRGLVYVDASSGQVIYDGVQLFRQGRLFGEGGHERDEHEGFDD